MPSQIFLYWHKLFDFRLILSITAHCIFAVEPSVGARWKGILIENIYKNKKTKNCPKIIFLIFFKHDKLVENYHLLLPSKPLEGDFCCL
jgi:hypothetical protein